MQYKLPGERLLDDRPLTIFQSRRPTHWVACWNRTPKRHCQLAMRASPTLEHAAKLWTYLSGRRAHDSSDAIVICCSYDLRVCDYACALLRRGIAPRLAITGGAGNWTRHLWDVPEAHVFKERALQNRVDPKAIVVEDRATNFGENLAFTRQLLPALKRITFVTKPNSVLRVRLTVPVQWPEITCFVDAPAIAFPEEVSNVVGLFGVINEMVGDIDRIVQYSGKGFQVPHELPEDVLQSWRFLVEQGFDHHLVPRQPG